MRKRFLFSKNFYEKQEWERGSLVCGIDEVGRGCLAGPVVAAAVILFSNSNNRLLKDSKELDKKELQKAYNWIIKNSWYSFCPISHVDIDQFNIWQATLMAMRQAALNVFYGSDKQPSIILVDAMPLSLKGTQYEGIEIQHFIEGERHSASIAAASIIAKVVRDAMMEVYDPLFPAYNLSKHKGYATKAHRESLQQDGHSIIHRLTYLKNFEKSEMEAIEEQTSLFC